MSKMKAVFICEEKMKYRFGWVYSTDKVNVLKSILMDLDTRLYSKEEVLADPMSFSDTEYIFSTWGMERFERGEIKKLFPKLKCVFFAAGSVRGFAQPFLDEGVRIFSAQAANAIPVAEFAAAQIILAGKGFFSISSYLKKTRDYTGADALFRTFRGNYNTKVGIIGAGAIGRHVIKLLGQYTLDILVYDPFLPVETASELGVKKTTLEEIFSSCSVISNHLADNDDTKNIIGADLLSRLVRNAVLINTGRGAQIVEEELIKLLEMRPDVTALLDVTYPEPPDNASKLYELENCILTPHMAGSSGYEFRRMAEFITDDLVRYLNGEPCKYEIGTKIPENMA